MNKVRIIHRLLVLYTIVLVGLVASTFLSFINVQPAAAVTHNGLGCVVSSGDGINWNIQCSGGPTQTVKLIAFQCNENNGEVCLPSTPGVRTIYNQDLPSAPSNMSVSVTPSPNACGRVQFDVLVSPFIVEDPFIAGGTVHPFSIPCDTQPPEPTYFACNTTTFKCEKRIGSNPNQDGCSFENQACDPRVPNFSIVKEVTDANGNVISGTNILNEYQVGDPIYFKVTITNTGERGLHDVRFVDRFLNQFMSFQSGTVSRQGTTVNIITSGPGANARINNNGYLVIDDLNDIVNRNNFGIGQTFVLNLQFRAERITTDQAPSQTGDPLTNFFGNEGRMRNIVLADPAEMDLKYDRVPVRIVGPAQNPSVAIVKNVTGNQTNFEVGDNVPFDVTITNNGNTTFDVLSFRDTFDPTYLQFRSGTITFGNTQVPLDIGYVNNTTGRITIPDLTIIQPLNKNFAPTESVRFDMVFEAMADTNGNQTINTAFTRADALPEIQDDARVTIDAGTVNQPSIQIDKSFASGFNNNFEVGDEVRFLITITNNGNTTLNTVRFQDFFDRDFLAYRSGSATFGNQTIDFTNMQDILIDSGRGQIAINDLSAEFNRDLAPGESITLTISFEALASTANEPNGETINTARVTSDNGLTDEDDQNVIIIEQVNQPSIIIDKRLAPGFTNPFGINDQVDFLITITNNGNTTLNTVRFDDNYDPSFLDFQTGTVTFGNQTRTFNQLTGLTVNETTGQITITDLTAEFNQDLAAGQNIVLRLTFMTVAATTNEPNAETLNVATVTADNLTDEDDQNVIIIDDTPGTKAVDIDKFIANNNGNVDREFLVGEEIIFQIRVENIGTLPLNVIQFTDDFDPAYLQINLEDSYIVKNNDIINRFENLTGVSGYNPATGTLTIADLTSPAIGLGDLNPGEEFNLFIYFTALQATNNLPNGETINHVEVNADGEEDEDDQPVVIIPDAPIFAACNQTCGGNVLCQTGLVCDLRVNRCRLPSNPDSLTCTPNNESLLDVEKVLTNDDLANGRYQVGDEIVFQIRVENKSTNQTFDVISFLDTYDPEFLRLDLQRSFITKNNNLAGAFRDLRIPQVISNPTVGMITINDISTIGTLGNLGPGEFYDLYFSFTALAATTNEQGGVTINVAQARADNHQDQDDEDVQITPDTPIIVTNQCNALCGGNIFCDPQAGLTCVNVGNNESRCRLLTNPSSATCQPPAGNGGDLSIIKQANPDSDGDKVFTVAENVTYNIRITNTGTEALTSVRFSDRYEPQFLSFQGGSITKYNAAGQAVGTLPNLANLLNINSAGYMEITNIAATSLGGLNPGEYYVVTTNFLTRTPGVTRNIVIASGTTQDGDQTGDRQAEEVITIENISTDL